MELNGVLQISANGTPFSRGEFSFSIVVSFDCSVFIGLLAGLLLGLLLGLLDKSGIVRFNLLITLKF